MCKMQERRVTELERTTRNMEKKPQISLIIPYMESDPGKPAILKRWTDSVPHVDELIISSNWKEGYVKPINRGLHLAKGDYLLVSNDDLIWERGDIYDLCKPGVVTSPVVNGIHQDFWGCCFMIPRDIYEQIGDLYEGYRISYYDDDDYWCRLKQAGVKTRGIKSVQIQHPEGGRTLHTIEDRDEWTDQNRRHFIDRWGMEPEAIKQYYETYNVLPESKQNSKT